MDRCPSHYKLGKFEAREVIAEVLDKGRYVTSFMEAYYLASALKYVLRCTGKYEFYRDVEKARNFLDFILEEKAAREAKDAEVRSMVCETGTEGFTS